MTDDLVLLMVLMGGPHLRYPDFKPLPCPTAPKVKKPNPSGPGHHQGGQGPALLQAFHCNITFAIQTCSTTLHIATVPSVYPIASQHTDTAQQFCCHNFCIRNTNLPYNFAYCTIQTGPPFCCHIFCSINLQYHYAAAVQFSKTTLQTLPHRYCSTQLMETKASAEIAVRCIPDHFVQCIPDHFVYTRPF